MKQMRQKMIDKKERKEFMENQLKRGEHAFWGLTYIWDTFLMKEINSPEEENEKAKS